MVNLRWFRKHQKVMLVVFGVILMAVFVLGSVVPFFGSSGGGASREQIARANQPIVQWSGGQMTRGQIQRMLEMHFATMNFQEALLRDSIGRSPQGPLVRPIQPISDTSVDSADRSIFSRFLLAEYARNMLGLVVSDEMVYDYLNALTNSDVTPQYLAAISRQAGGRAGYNQLHEYLKMEIAAMLLGDIIEESFLMGGGGAAPANVLDAWQAFLQNEKQIECAVEEFNTADFVAQINEQPSASELRGIYEQGKARDPDPTAQEPGFKRPRQARVEYVAADANTFLDLAIQDVTPEQVLAEYNRLVEVKDPLVMEQVPSESESNPPADGEKLEDDAAPAPGGETQPMEKSGDPAPNPPGDNPPADKTDESSDPKADAPAEKKDGSADFDRALSAAFVAYRPNRQETAESTPPQESKPTDSKTQETQADPQDPAPSGDAASGDESMSAANQEPQKPQDSPSAGDNPAAANPPAGDSKALQDEPSQRPKKLDAALELAIKQRMKREEANQQMSMALEKVRDAMNDYSLNRSDHESTKSLPKADQIPLPEPLNLESLAAENHLRYGITELSTYEDLIKDPVGMATEFLQDPATGRFGTKRVADDIFVNFDRKQLYSLDECNAIGETYVYWLTEKVDSRIPSFEEAQGDVLDYWKRRKSIEMAKSAAEKVRDDLSSGGKMLSLEHPDQAKLTGGFRWFQDTMDQTRYGNPQGVRNAGEEFMAAAFGLKPNEIAVAPNADETAAYVIQLVADDPRTDEQLRDQYLDHVATVRQVVPSATSSFYNRKAVDQLVKTLNDDLKVEWLAY